MIITKLSQLGVLWYVCNSPQMINKTKEPWNDFDRQHLTIATKRCGEIYKNSPCIKVFIKRTPTDFSVICGKGK